MFPQVNILHIIYNVYSTIINHIAESVETLGFTQTQAIEFSQLFVIFIAVLLTYLTSHLFTAFRKYVATMIILYALILVVVVIMK